MIFRSPLKIIYQHRTITWCFLTNSDDELPHDDELPQPGADAFNEFNLDEVDNSNMQLWYQR